MIPLRVAMPNSVMKPIRVATDSTPPASELVNAVTAFGDLAVSRHLERYIPPVSSERNHLPPTAHATFVSDGVAICTHAVVFAGAELRFIPQFFDRRFGFTLESGAYKLQDTEPLNATTPFGVSSG